MKFYKCLGCGEVFISSGFVKCVDCGGKLEELVPNSGDGAPQKHTPVYEVKGDKVIVSVGEVLHPMESNHLIEFIFICGDTISDSVYFDPGDKPEAVFDYEKGSKIYAYCNVHGLWSCEIE